MSGLADVDGFKFAFKSNVRLAGLPTPELVHIVFTLHKFSVNQPLTLHEMKQPTSWQPVSRIK